MIRLLSSLAILVSLACAQSPAPSPPLVVTKTREEATSANAISPREEGSARPLPDVTPLPSGKATLLGGTIQSVDYVRDRLILQVFGGRRTAVLFDERTRVFRDGKAASLDELKTGERAYLDTTLDRTDIFARNIRIAAQGPPGQSSGQIVDFRPGSGELIVRDTLSPEPVKMRLASNAAILNGDRTAEPAELRPGTLVNLVFTPGDGEAPIVRQISILASPGAAYVFAGRIEHLDLRRGLLVLVDPRDNKSYEVYFDAPARRLAPDLRQGADVTVQASFDGTRYQSRDITVNSVSAK
ncbi:MAG: hypothetical protein WAQ52_03810 [Terriglobales bacterium]